MARSSAHPSQAPSPHCATTSNSKGLKIPLPEGFTGTYSKYKKFLTDLKLYFIIKEINDDSSRIIIALRCMTGPAGEWAQTIANKAINEDFIDFGTWDNFVNDMDHRFKVHAHKHKAHQQAKDYKQGLMHTDQFIQELERLFCNAGLADEEERSQILTHNT